MSDWPNGSLILIIINLGRDSLSGARGSLIVLSQTKPYFDEIISRKLMKNKNSAWNGPSDPALRFIYSYSCE